MAEKQGGTSQKMAASADFKSGDLVWAKMKGYPAWPAQIIEPPSDTKAPKHKKAQYVKFFGSENFAWIPDGNIVHHSESVLNASSKKKSALFKKAIDALLSCSREEKQSFPEIGREEILNVDQNSHEKVVTILSTTKTQNRKKSNKKVTFQDMIEECNINSTSTSCKVPKYDSTVETFVPSMDVDDKFYDVPMSDETSLEIKHLEPTKKKIGFIGLGHMGQAIVQNLLLSGHDVTVWNRTSYKCAKFISMGAKKASSLADLVVECDVTFCCVSDPDASKDILFMDKGILQGLQTAEKLGLGPKGYIELSSIPPDTSLEISEAITTAHGIYLEAPLCGTRLDAEKGTLVILAAGDRELFADCETCFHAIGTHAFYMTRDVGYAAKVSLMLSTLSGSICGIVAEALVLAEKLKIDKKILCEGFCNGPLNCDDLTKRFELMNDPNFKTITPLEHMQKPINAVMKMSDKLNQPMPIVAACLEVYKQARAQYGESDLSALCKNFRY